MKLIILVKSEFAQNVYNACSLIPAGKVTTYFEIARFLKNPKSHRSVGNILNKNPDFSKCPCHRVVRKSGEIGGYVFGNSVKIRKLSSEGLTIKNGNIVNLEEKLIIASDLRVIENARKKKPEEKNKKTDTQKSCKNKK